MAKRATKTSTLSALRSVNAAMRLAIGFAAQSSTEHVEYDDETGRTIRYVEEPFDDAAKIAHVKLALDWLRVAEMRIEHARNHLHSYERRLVDRAEANRQRADDDERALAENDEQRDYAEERFNDQLMKRNNDASEDTLEDVGEAGRRRCKDPPPRLRDRATDR